MQRFAEHRTQKGETKTSTSHAVMQSHFSDVAAFVLLAVASVRP